MMLSERQKHLASEVNRCVRGAGGSVISWPQERRLRFTVMDEGIGEQLLEQLGRYGLFGSRIGMVERVGPDGIGMATLYEIELPREPAPQPAPAVTPRGQGRALPR